MKTFLRIFTVVFFLAINQTGYANNVMYKDGYIQLPKHMREKVNLVANNVQYYFDFNCVYCRNLHPYMTTWGDTLPEYMSFTYQPIVINDPLYFMNAAAWKFVEASTIGEDKKYKYMDHIFTYLPRVTNEHQLARLIKESLNDVGLDIKDFASRYGQGEYDNYLNEQINTQKILNIEVTPSVVIGGEYLTHLGLSDGNPKDFITLLNAVTSYYIYQERENDDKSTTK
ncbi:thioredoxin domain-containing protein [Thalassotalea piscium]|uniref:Protein-disulfide isomerase n=1 Tax=Thalassotalea piscium TaxID=1230533 RepID=A0A7X0NKL2_9GAMM|nr:thioredoxin domain-containing protein [Thalassotalea piscium]MBB6545135.1 protein-disulfide isomerase [Thalassotalea piscium]